MAAQEVNPDGWIWTLPADRSKNGRSRVTPLVGFSREIVEARMKANCDGPLFLAEGGGPLTSNDVSSMIVKRRSQIPVAHFTSHDLRRTVATGLVDLGFPMEVVAAVLGHEAGSKDVRTLIRHYVRSDLVDRKRLALEAWDRCLRQILKGATPPTNVMNLHRTAPQRVA
jgi:integrase